MITNARRLRKDSTHVEQRLWYALRDRRFGGIKFRRQHPIGGYVVDFCAPSIRLVIELDGGQHAENKGRDERRTQFLRGRGYRVMRFWNNEVNETLEGVMERIREAIEKSPDTPSPWPSPPSGERGNKNTSQ